MGLTTNTNGVPSWYSAPVGAVEDESGAINALRTAYEGSGWLSTLVWNVRNEYLAWPDEKNTSVRMIVEGFLAEIEAMRKKDAKKLEELEEVVKEMKSVVERFRPEFHSAADPSIPWW